MVMRMPEYIKREAVLEWFRPYTHEDILLDPVDVIGEIRDIPSADVVETVHGKVTEYEADEWYGPIYQCHECGCEMMVREPVGRWEDVPIRPKLCANCGAMFDGERKDNG